MGSWRTVFALLWRESICFVSHYINLHRIEVSQFFSCMCINVQFLLVFAGYETFLNILHADVVDSRSDNATVKFVFEASTENSVDGTLFTYKLLYFCRQVWLCKDQNISVKVVCLSLREVKTDGNVNETIIP